MPQKMGVERKIMIRSLVAVVLFAVMFSVTNAEAVDQLKVKWKISHTLNPASVYHQAALKFKEYVEDKTDGNFKCPVLDFLR